MTTLTFDTLACARKLEEAGFTRQQAEAQADAMRQQAEVQASALRDAIEKCVCRKKSRRFAPKSKRSNTIC